MKALFNGTYNRRRYPSPHLGRYVEAFVKEIPHEELPADFVKGNTMHAIKAGCSLFTADTGGFRPWRASEHLQMVEAGFELLQEFTWIDVWQIDTAEPSGVLDILKYTEFFGEATMDRFDEFVTIARPLMEKYAGYVTQSCGGGVSISFASSPSLAEWKGISEAVWSFNKKYFTIELPRSGHIKSWRETSGVWFGHC